MEVVLSSEVRDDGTGFRTGEGGRVGTVVVVVTVVTCPALCLDSVVCCRAYLIRFVLAWLGATTGAEVLGACCARISTALI